VAIPVILATLAFLAARWAFRERREISVFRTEDAFHGAVALSRRESEKKIVGHKGNVVALKQ
jgi:hypothetical protein